MVTEEKIYLWLQEDILNRWATTTLGGPQSKRALGKRKRGSRATVPIAPNPTLFQSTEEEDLLAIAAQLQVPLEAVPDMLADDQLDAADSVEIDDNGEVIIPGALLKSGTVDSYVAAVAELHKVQYSTGLPIPAIIRGLALWGLLES